MPKEHDRAIREPAERPSGPSPEEKKDRIKAAIFFFGVIALMFVLKLILGY